MSRRVVTIALTDKAWEIYDTWPKGKRSERMCNCIIQQEVNARRRKELNSKENTLFQENRAQKRQIRDLQFRLTAITAGMPDPGEKEWRL
jgi:hypothetical protein